jgi:aryl-alcohol dehydrogenase-like predicted oxidoreductase
MFVFKPGTDKEISKMTEMFTRTLGRSGIAISPMGFGCWAIGGPFWDGETPQGWGEVDDAESVRAIQASIDLGVTFFDTAGVYGAGHSERVLGRALAGRRDKYVIATKFGPLFDESTRHVTGGDASPAGIRQACADSLRRLNTDYIDLYQFHFNDHPVAAAGPVRDTLEALVKEGKIRAYGWSTDFPDRAEFFAQGERCAAIQLQLNVLDDNPAVLAVCERRDLAAINRGPLAMGLLTGKYDASIRLGPDDVRGTKSPVWMKYFKSGQPNPEFTQKRDAVRGILASNGRTVAQGALAWLWARSPKTVPIPGIRTVTQAQENAKAMQFGPLAPSQMDEINKLLGR